MEYCNILNMLMNIFSYLRSPRSVFFLLSMGLCLYQISKICEMYFSYKTTISMSYENISEISLPALSICVDKSFLLKPKYLTQLGINQTERFSETDSKKINGFLGNLTIKEQFNAMNGKEYLYYDCKVLVPRSFATDKNPYIKCEDVSPVKISMDLNYVCFTFFSQRDGQSDSNFIIDISQRKYEVFSKELMFWSFCPNIPFIHLFFHSRNEKIMPWQAQGLSWLPSNQFIYYIKYRKVISRSLPFPFDTNCFNYSEDGFVSENDCINQCQLKYWKTVLGYRWPGILPAYDNLSDLYIVDMFPVEFVNYYLILDKEVGIKCRKECKSMTSCYKEDFEIKLNKYQQISDVIWVSVWPPTIPDQVIQHMPQICVEEFVIYIGSLIGLYFGFSFIMLSDVCSVAVKYIVQNISNNQYLNTKFNSIKNITINQKLVFVGKRNKIEISRKI